MSLVEQVTNQFIIKVLIIISTSAGTNQLKTSDFSSISDDPVQFVPVSVRLPYQTEVLKII